MKRLAAAIAVLALAGCGSAATRCPTSLAGKFDDGGFESKVCYLKVNFESQKHKRLINKSWTVDNYDYYAESGKFKLKKGPAFCGDRVIDRDGDGKLEKERGLFFELKLSHTKTEGVMWLQYFELTKKNKKKKLEVFLKNYAKSLSGTGLVIEGNVHGILTVKEDKYAAKIIESEAAELGTQTAIVGTVEIMDLDMKEIDADYKGDLVRVMLTKHTCWKRQFIPEKGEVWKSYKCLLVAGYRNSPEDFEESLEDFETFVGNIEMLEK